MIQSIQLPKITITSSHARPWIEPKDSHLHLLYPRPLQRLPHRAQALAHGLGVLQLQALVLDAFDLAAVPFRGGTMSCKWIHMRGSRGHFLASATQPPSRSQLTALVQLTALWHIGQKLEKLMASKVTTRRLSSSDTEDQPRPCVPDHGPRKGPWGGGPVWFVRISGSGLRAFGPSGLGRAKVHSSLGRKIGQQTMRLGCTKGMRLKAWGFPREENLPKKGMKELKKHL